MKRPSSRLLTVLALLAAAVGSDAADISLIAHPGVDASGVSADDIQAMYLNKRRQWPDGRGVELATLEDGPVHQAFLERYVGKSPSAYRSYWKRIVFTGKGAMPDSFASDAEVIAFVKATPGAIAYVDAATELPTDVKRLEVTP